MSAAPLAAGVPGSGLWRSVWKLLRLRWVIFISGFRRLSPRRKLVMLLLGLLVAGGLAFVFFLSWSLLMFLRSPQLGQLVGDTRPLLASVPVLVVSAAFLGLLLTSFGVLLQALYLAGDMDFLLSAPLPMPAIFIAKLLQAVLPNFGLVLLFSLPVLYGLGLSAGYNLLYFPLVLVVLALIALAAAGLSSLLVMAVVRIFPARRVAEVLGFFAAILSLICSQSGQFANYASDLSDEQATRAIGLVSRFDLSWSPLAWAGRGLVAIGEGRWLIGSGLLLPIIVLTIAIFTLSLLVAQRLYYTGWASVQISPRKKVAPRPARLPAMQTSPLGHLLPAPVRGILVKDFLMLRRDLRSMSQVVTPLILGVIYAILLIRSGGQPPAGRGEAPPEFMQAMKNLMAYGNVAISLFVGWSLLSRLATMGFSQEGRHYWLLKVAPVSVFRLLAAKFLVAYLPALALVWGFLIAISLLQRLSLPGLAFGLAAVSLIMAGTAGLNLAIGVAGANFNWEDPRRVTQGGYGCLGSLASMAFLVVSLALFFGPDLLFRLLGASQALGQLVGLVLGAAASLAFAFIPLWLVRYRVPRLAED